ncbi:MAG: glucokinase [Pseudoxanthomonas suwonensis]|nr:glucokinase [Pseudoxanthomonas suwonensis]
MLVADIGGTHARFGLTDPGRATPAVTDVRAFATAAHPGLVEAVRAYLAPLAVRPRLAVLAVAAPVPGDHTPRPDATHAPSTTRLTNHAWSFERHGLQQALGLDAVHLLNDFAAVAHAVPWLQPAQLPCLHGQPPMPLQGPVTVLGPGTGLGVALLVRQTDAAWQVLATEGGHASFAPLDDTERTIARHLQERHGRVSNERVLSGPGLAQIELALRHARNPAAVARDAAAILAAAVAGDDPAASAALARFFAILGSVTGDIALLHGARSVVIAGGIVPRCLPLLQQSDFVARMRDKGRLAGWFDDLPVQVVTHPQPGLLGAAAVATRITASMPGR